MSIYGDRHGEPPGPFSPDPEPFSQTQDSRL
jgi:hypothetical protein